MRELLDQGVVGNIYRTSKISGLVRTGLPRPARLAGDEGGEALLNQGIHGVDMLQWLRWPKVAPPLTHARPTSYKAKRLILLTALVAIPASSRALVLPVSEN